MTNRRRMLVTRTLVMLTVSPALYFIWLRLSTQGPSSDALSYPRTFEFGVVRWLALQHAQGVPASAIGATWAVDPGGVVVNLALSVGLFIIVKRLEYWLVQNSALKEHCDRCGYATSCSPEPDRCPECGDYPQAQIRALAISPTSWVLLLTSLVFLGAAGAVCTVSSLLRTTAFAVSTALNPRGGLGQLPWRGEQGSALMGGLLFIGAALFLIWFYREPAKHPPDRGVFPHKHNR